MPSLTTPNIIDAKAAYNEALKAQASVLGDKAHLLTNLQSAGATSASPLGESSFANTIAKVFNDGISAQQRAERAGLQALRGEIDQTELVTAITDAEATLNTIVAVRDRVLSAYQEISRLPI